MVLNPLNELKRRLEDTTTPWPKRLCLAKNVVRTNHFPLGPKERVIGDWLEELMKDDEHNTESIRDVLSWVTITNCVTAEFKSTLIDIIANYVEVNTLQLDDIESIILFLTNESIRKQLHNQIKQYLLISKILLKHTKDVDVEKSRRILDNYISYYKDSKQKLQFIVNFIEGDNLELIFDCFEIDSLKNTALDVCQNILFPMSKKSFYSHYLQKLIRKDNIEKLIEEKGDNIQSVLKVMSLFFEFPKGRSNNSCVFLQRFIETFVSSYKAEHQLIFAFYIICVNCLNLEQDYIIPTSKMATIDLENGAKDKRNVFLNMLESLLQNDVNINVRLTDTMGEKAAKLETKKTFILLLQNVIINFLTLRSKVDKISLKIITVALKIDPALIEKKMNEVLPPLMVSKKTNEGISNAYEEMLNCLLETLFKLSRGTLFINQILPHLKMSLESVDKEQIALNSKLVQTIENGVANDKITSKIINGEDVFPQNCIEKYGQLTSELMYRQNVELLTSLQKDFNTYCLSSFEGGIVASSAIVLTEVLSAILGNFFYNCKMSDHTVPQHIAVEFWSVFESFESNVLKKFGKSLLKNNFGPQLTLSFLKLCQGYAQLKILHIQYYNHSSKCESSGNTGNVYDLSMVLPCLKSDQWTEIKKQSTNADATLLFDNLLLLNIIYSNLNIGDSNDNMSETKTYLIVEITNNLHILENNNYFCKVLLSNLSNSQIKQFTKAIFNNCLAQPEINILEIDAIQNHKPILTSLVLEVLKSILKIIKKDESSFSKAISKRNFDINQYCQELNVKEYFELTAIEYDSIEIQTITNCLEFLKQLKVYNLNENLILTTIFVLISTKHFVDKKKLRNSIDMVLQSIFELSPKNPDVYKLFPIDFMFSFSDNVFLNLVTLTKKSLNPTLIIKMILELTVKKVKTESEIVRKVVEILLSNLKTKKASSFDYFNNKVFQISCIILPIIAKEKKNIAKSSIRTILAELQENMHKALLKAFKNIDFKEIHVEVDNTEDGNYRENCLATLTAMDAYSLTLAKYCESNNVDEIQNLDCLWSGLEFFIQNAIFSFKNPDIKNNQIEAPIQLLSTVLRYIKKLDSHKIFHQKDEIFEQMWYAVKSRLIQLFQDKNSNHLFDDLSAVLRFLCELSSIECFTNNIIKDLWSLVIYQSPDEINEELITKHQVARFQLTHALKSFCVGAKCVSISKFSLHFTKNVSGFLRGHFENGAENKCGILSENVCELLVNDLHMICEVVLAPKKISLNYKLMDAILDLEQSMIQLLNLDQTWRTFFKLFDTCLYVLNSLLLARNELLEDRWPCFMYCYRTLLSYLCKRSSTQMELERDVEERLAEIAHTFEKLTQSMCKRKSQLSRLATYAIGDLCHFLEATAPSRLVRQHLENCVALLIQLSDSSYSVSFLRRALAGSAGHMTMTNLYTMYKRYHKYVGNA